MKTKHGDKILLRGDAFNQKEKVKIVIKVPYEIYLKEKVQYRKLDFIEKILKKEIETIEIHGQGNANYFETLVSLEILPSYLKGNNKAR